MMKIAVVGATGPTGIHLAAELRKTVASMRVITHSCDSSHSFPPFAIAIATAYPIKRSIIAFYPFANRDVNCAPVVCVALLGLMVVYALSRAPRRPDRNPPARLIDVAVHVLRFRFILRTRAVAVLRTVTRS
jgi:nucleoside-diphosphate-sugar epimerase